MASRRHAGPWRVEPNKPDNETLIIAKGENFIAVLESDATVADARLIAAAPDVFAALKRCEFVLGMVEKYGPEVLNEHIGPNQTRAALDAARAAIAKAEGK